MDFTQAAHEVVKFVTHEPLLDFAAAAFVVLGGAAALQKRKENKAYRTMIEASDARLPKVRPFKAPPITREL